MTNREFLWWTYRFHPKLFNALARAGAMQCKITQITWAVHMEAEMTGYVVGADSYRDSIDALTRRAEIGMGDWAPFVRACLAPTANPAYRWVTRWMYVPSQPVGLMQFIPSTFGREQV